MDDRYDSLPTVGRGLQPALIWVVLLMLLFWVAVAAAWFILR